MTTPLGVQLIIHIGTGKTGTTSIQNTLAKRRGDLLNQGVNYLGLMLENAEPLMYEWQKPTTVNDTFYKLEPSVKTEQLYNVLFQCVADANEKGLKKLIWSNESLFDHPDDILPVISKLQTTGIDPVVILYIRGYEDWARSAYVQWGIKHKTYKGPLLPFRSWAKDRLPNFFEHTKKFNDALGEKLWLRNFDENPDVVQDFISLCNLPIDTSHNGRRSNEAPAEVELLMRALFNNQILETALPQEFDQAFGANVKDLVSPRSYLANLLPVEKDISWIADMTARDRTAVNEIMLEKGQLPLKSHRNFSETPEHFE
jgi:hypothetical protein